MSRLASLFSVVVLTLALGCNLASVPLVPTATPAPTQPVLTCNEIITAALEAVGPVCNATSRNEVCYGNRLVNAELYPGAQAVFERVGDLTALQNIRLISTTPWNEAQQTWGVALLKAQVNLPDSLPGENVTFLLYGGATMEGVSPRMEAVILNTGIGRATCKDAPVSAALVQAPIGSVVTMNINGANLIIGSTLHLTAVQNEQMSIGTINGTVIVDALGKTEIVTGGAQVKMPLGAEGGLTVVGPPSEPEPFDLKIIEVAPLELLPETVEIPDPITAKPAAEESPTAIPTTEMLPTDTATPRPSATRPIITIPAPCFPRTDWIYRYTIARGDTLFSIASRVGISPALLQAGNCIPNANQIFAGQVLRVPVLPISTDTPIPSPTDTFTPTGSPTATDTLTPTITHTPTFTPTVTPSPTLSPTPITPAAIIPTLTPAPTLTPVPTFTPTPIPSVTVILTGCTIAGGGLAAAFRV